MDVHDPVQGAHSLEVSLVLIALDPEKTMKCEGFDAKVETKAAIAGRRRFTGLLDGCDAGGVLRLLREEGVVLIALDDVLE